MLTITQKTYWRRSIFWCGDPTVAMQDLCCDWLKWLPRGPKYDILISNVLPHRKYDIEYNPCLLPRKQGSVVNMYYVCTMYIQIHHILMKDPSNFDNIMRGWPLYCVFSAFFTQARSQFPATIATTLLHV